MYIFWFFPLSLALSVEWTGFFYFLFTFLPFFTFRSFAEEKKYLYYKIMEPFEWISISICTYSYSFYTTSPKYKSSIESGG